MKIISPQNLLEAFRDPLNYSRNNSFFKFYSSHANPQRNTFQFQGIELNDALQLNTLYYNCDIKFIGCKLIDLNISSKYHILIFEHSSVGNLNITNLGTQIDSINTLFSKFDSIKVIEQAMVSYIAIENGNIDVLSIASKSTAKEIHLLSNSKLKIFSNANGIVDLINIDIHSECDSIFNSESGLLKNIEISNESLVGTIFSTNSTINHFNLSSNSACRYLRIDEYSNIDKITTHCNSHLGDLIIQGNISQADICSNISKLIVGSITTENIIKIRSSQIGEMSISKNSNSKLNLYIQDSQISCFSFTNSFISSDDIINIERSSFYILNLSQLNNFGKIVFADFRKLESWDCILRDDNDKVIVLKTNSLKYNSLKSSALFNEFGYNGSTFLLSSSDLGNCSFINCNLDLFNNILISNSKIIDSFFADVILPSTNKFLSDRNIHDLTLNSIHIEDHKRLFFGQVKSIYFKQGDYARGAVAQSKELESLRMQLKLEKKWYSYKWHHWINPIKNKDFINNKKDRIVLFLSRWTSNYSTNWIRAAVTTICVSFLTFIIYCFAIGYRPGTDLRIFFELSSFSFQYLNPLRDEDSGQFFEYIKSHKFRITPLARVIDYLSRIIIAFLVYQTISSFRRLGKIGN